MKNLINCFLFLTSVGVYGQETIFGDTTGIRNIQSKCSIIYDTKDTTIFLLTKATFYQKALNGTNLIVYSYKKNITRIVALSTTTSGLLGVEYYYWDNRLILIYETMEYYDSDSPKDQIRNFKNIPYWESRFYLDNNQLVAHTHSGRKGIEKDYKAQREIENSKKIVDFIKEHTSLN